MKGNIKAYVDYYLGRLEGADGDDAFHSLIEASRDAIPLLVDAYRKEKSPSKRVIIVEIIRHFRYPESIAFLAEVLGDNSDAVWKQGLDGFVGIGGEAVVDVLCRERNRQKSSVKREWLDEAIEQVRNNDAENSTR